MTLTANLAKYATFELDDWLLRPCRYEDLDDFYQIVSDPTNLPFIFPAVAHREEAAELLTHSFLKTPLGVWAIVDKETGRFIGAIRFEKLQEESRQAEIGYFLRRDYCGRGIMTQVLQTLVYLSFYHLGLKELLIVTHLENIASQRVAEKAGFQLLRQYKGSDRYTHQMRTYQSYCLKQSDVQML